MMNFLCSSGTARGTSRYAVELLPHEHNSTHIYRFFAQSVSGLSHVKPFGARCMAGHSKWQNIRHHKAAQDKKKMARNAKLARAVEIAARHGTDVADNLQLGYAIQNAKSAGVPKEVILRAVARAEGGGADAWEEVTYEGTGPGGVSFMVDCHTDNRKRTAPQVRSAFKHYGGELLSTGAAAFAFATHARVIVDMTGAAPDGDEQVDAADATVPITEDALIELALEAGADEVEVDNDSDVGTVLAGATQLHAVAAALRSARVSVLETGVVRLPVTEQEVLGDDATRVQSLVDALEELEDVQTVNHNGTWPDMHAD